MSSLNSLAESLAGEIQSRTLLDNAELVALIRVSVRNFLPGIISDRVSKYEQEMQLLRDAAVSATGTKDYLLIGNKIGALRQRIKNERTALENIKREIAESPATIFATVVDVKNIGLTAITRLSFFDEGENLSIVKVFGVKSEDDMPVLGDSIEIKRSRGKYMVVSQSWMS